MAEPPRSPASPGREEQDDPFAALEAPERALLTAAEAPDAVDPMLATLSDTTTEGDAWVYEPKLDGIRAVAFRLGGEVRLRSRNQQRLEATYPELVEALAAQATPDIVVDGEVVAFDGERPSFERLQGRMQITDPDRALRSGIEVHYFVFDLLHLDGFDTTGLPLQARKRLLAAALAVRPPLHLVRDIAGNATDLLDAACRRGWEGLIAKRVEARYRPTRSRDWLKLKCSRRQEFVVGGWSDPEGTRTGLGALLVGYRDGDDLVYAGKVGTGFSVRTLEDLEVRLGALERGDRPFTRGETPRKGVHWADPELVCEVAFTEWTRDGRLRHPRFLGLRTDKDPADVVREEG